MQVREQAQQSFGDWLRQRRQERDLTQAELARQVGCSTITLRKLETEERRPSKQMAERLAEVLSVAPGDRPTFLRFARGDPFAEPAALRAEPNFETLTRREREVLALLAQGYSAPEIATKLTLAVSSVKSHVQHVYGKLSVNSKRQALTRAKQLGLLAAEHTVAVAEPMPPSSAPPSLKHDLPLQLTSFIGREQEVADVRRLVSTARLVTLTGPGGTGKTRLAIETAAGLLDKFSDGVWLVELASLAEAALVPQALATVLTIRQVPGRSLSDMLIDHLRPQQLLLVLNNCEHLIQACAELTEQLLHACPRLTILTTSREVLGIAGERAYAVPALSLPSTGPIKSIAALAQSEAVQLFVERAKAVMPRFTLTMDNAPAVVQICRQLDGIPLAIELAAARVMVIRVEQIAARLDDRFRLLTSGSRTALPRHQTLLALMDWSHDLLSPTERVFLRRLAVFAGGWALAGAEAVCAITDDDKASDNIDSSDVLDLLQQLVKKSLVVVERPPDTEPRFHLLETIRQYASARLLASGECDAVRQRHAAYYLELAEAGAPGVGDQEARPAWLNQLELEHDNLRAAFVWSQSVPDKPELVLRLTDIVMWLWSERGYWTKEIRGWVETALARPGAANHPQLQALTTQHLGLILAWQEEFEAAQSQFGHSLRLFHELKDRGSCARALSWLGWTAREQGDAATARVWTEESLSLSTALGNKSAICNATVSLAEGMIIEGDLLTAKALLEGNLPVARELANPSTISWSLNLLGNIAQLQGEFEQAMGLHETSLSLARELGPRDISLVFAHQGLGETALAQGDMQLATTHLVEALVLSQDLGKRAGAAWCLAGIAGAAVLDQEPERAAQLWGAAEALRLSIGARHAPAARATHERLMAITREQLGETAFAAAWAEGQAMTMEQAVAEATQDG